MNYRILLIITVCLNALVSMGGRPLKILCIGNSFSEDAVEQDLHRLAELGGHEMIIGNLYFPACSIDRHWNNLINNTPDYSFRKIGLNGKADTINNCTISRALRSESWDIITFQQGSAVSGVYSSYKELPRLIKRVRQIVGRRPKFLWHQTWSYAPASTHPGFKKYSNDQLRMYASIIYCTKKVLEENPELKGVIPTGTAIQDARTSFLGDNLTRDGYHLDLTVGRYIASCTWYGVLFSRPFTLQTYIPKGMTLEEGEICRKAASEAILHPYSIINLDMIKK